MIDVIDHLFPAFDNYINHIERESSKGVAMWFPEKEVSKDSLIIGALESAFWEMVFKKFFFFIIWKFAQSSYETCYNCAISQINK